MVRFFDVGVNFEGFWNYDQMSLQVEDVYNILATVYPQFDFLLLLDQSSGHGKMREGALNVNTMGVRWGGCQQNLRETKIKDVGPYPSLLKVGDIQKMVFTEEDSGPFYLSNNQ